MSTYHQDLKARLIAAKRENEALKIREEEEKSAAQLAEELRKIEAENERIKADRIQRLKMEQEKEEQYRIERARAQARERESERGEWVDDGHGMIFVEHRNHFPGDEW